MDDIGFDLAPVTLPASLYRDPAAYAREREAVFARTWQFLGHESELAAAGDYLAAEIAGFPVLALRAGDESLRAFHNVCRHRAGPLVPDGGGNCGKDLVCRYHGWRYALDGRLRVAAGFGAAPGFDPRDYGLHPVRVESWRGFVFVNLDPDAEPLAALMEPLDPLWDRRARSTPPVALRVSHHAACDWKTYVENYLEGYHVGLVHPALAEEVDAARYTVTMHGAVAIHEAPPRDPGKVTEGLWAWVWPNLGLNVYRTGMMLERMTPAGPGRTRLDYIYFQDPAHAGDLDAFRAVSDQTTAEDISICETVQRNLDAGVYDTGVLSPRHEGGVAWFQRRLRQVHAG
ncbi:MAG TPA: aromatic ring-hydroxylating dioxygenase subunit alpha [Caulobacteraceae bacterium]|jgi:choline monooxygenase